MKKDRLLISAILFSAVWHIFWLSTVTVVVVPKIKKPIKFSSISFLGPILDRGVMTVSALAPIERTLLEKKYLIFIEDSFISKGERFAGNSYAEAGLNDVVISSQGNERLSSLAISAIDGSKLEPGRDID